MRCSEAVIQLWRIVDQVTPERRRDVLSFAGHRYIMSGELSELTRNESHLLACLDCEHYDECGANLRECRCSPKLKRESSSGEG